MVETSENFILEGGSFVGLPADSSLMHPAAQPAAHAPMISKHEYGTQFMNLEFDLPRYMYLASESRA